jgi:hypothetical protein
MFHDLDATLAALMRGEMALPDIGISFASPDDQFPPSGVTLPAVAFFLYDMRENVDLRSSEWETERQPTGMTTRRRPPARIDCSYLITAWPNANAPNPEQDEHRLLGDVVKVLLRHRRIPERYLRGELIHMQAPLPAKVSADSQLQSIGEFWQAMGGRPKATLHYSVTLSVDVFDPTEIGPEVTEKVIRVGQA